MTGESNFLDMDAKLATFITVINVMSALFLIMVVLVQGGNSGGVGAAFGGGNTQGVFGASGATSLLGKLTYFAAAVFMVTAIVKTAMSGREADVGLSGKIKDRAAIEDKVHDQDETSKPAASSQESSSAPSAEGAAN